MEVTSKKEKEKSPFLKNIIITCLTVGIPVAIPSIIDNLFTSAAESTPVITKEEAEDYTARMQPVINAYSQAYIEDLNANIHNENKNDIKINKLNRYLTKGSSLYRDIEKSIDQLYVKGRKYTNLEIPLESYYPDTKLTSTFECFLYYIDENGKEGKISLPKKSYKIEQNGDKFTFNN